MLTNIGIGCGLAALMFLFALASHASAQTITNADLGKKFNTTPAGPAVYAALAPRAFMPAPSLPPAGASVSVGDGVPHSGPWAFPAPSPERRLDGTLKSDPVQQYGFTGGLIIVDGYRGPERRSAPRRTR
jgi:hypothetical protein